VTNTRAAILAALSGLAAGGATWLSVIGAAGTIAVGDCIGVELDAVIAGSLRRVQHTTVAGVSGATLTLTNAVAEVAATGRRVQVCRWASK
jgi:hypothetical protein